ncbi:6358_t:CDS:2 [Cetraspora pellucida]|uniref:6358_t:CDS:1 n=1 Tax=Cetraspora pellucida TaxID=1433469 RepID=A0ACA9JW43_9GLOM|nr:6358_t:CDS:2 [Cetraspora pellucida]
MGPCDHKKTPSFQKRNAKKSWTNYEEIVTKPPTQYCQALMQISEFEGQFHQTHPEEQFSSQIFV